MKQSELGNALSLGQATCNLPFSEASETDPDLPCSPASSGGILERAVGLNKCWKVQACVLCLADVEEALESSSSLLKKHFKLPQGCKQTFNKSIRT